MCLPFEVVEWSQHDMVRLIHSSASASLNRQNVFPMSDVDPKKEIVEENNRATKSLIPFGN